MYYGRSESWNLRDTHMVDTLSRILKHRGPDAKAIVWAHNSHLGDARATDKSSRDEINVGQLCRELWGDKVSNIGCGTYTGTVAAAKNWGSKMRVMNVRPGLSGSYEELMHDTAISRFTLDLRPGRCDEQLRRALMKPRLERYIGVIYRPDTERMSHYIDSCLPKQFDGYIWFDESKSVGEIERTQPDEPIEAHETWPFGV